MAKALFHRNQRVYVKPVGTWANVEAILPQWVKGLEEPLKVHYDVGLGRDFAASELIADKSHTLFEDDADLSQWRVTRARNRWKEASELSGHPQPGTYPVVTTDEKNWGGWRVPSAEYDRDPQRIEFQARIIETAPRLMHIAKQLVQFAHQHPEDLPSDLIKLAGQARALLRRIYETPGEDHSATYAAE